MGMTPSELDELLAELSGRPGHEQVRSRLIKLLTDGLGAKPTEIGLEVRFEVAGRVDALLGRTVFEIKSNLSTEKRAGETQLAGYLREKEEKTAQAWVGVLTDGAEFYVYALREDGTLEGIGERKLSRRQAAQSIEQRAMYSREFLRWLESVVVVADVLLPEIEIIRAELGRESPLYRRSAQLLSDLWARHASNPEVALKRELWRRLLEVAYGDDVSGDNLFLQHTYLVVVAKAIATVALFRRLPATGRDLLDGRQFSDEGIAGAIEADFFDWVLADSDGDELVRQIAILVARFKLDAIEADVLKGLYESLIDPEQRHFLGEYYTPDWLAARICYSAIDRPSEQRVIDPACGSGTFLFHAVRRCIDAVIAEGSLPSEAIARSCQLVAGIDVHPVAVIFARATVLLALVPSMNFGRPPRITIPVYLGDALQWNRAELMGRSELEIEVPPVVPGASAERLRFPENLVVSPDQFESVLAAMLRYAEPPRTPKEFAAWLGGQSMSSADAKLLIATQGTLTALVASGRNHIWGYVARNMSRPIWLAGDRQKADVVIGNPPWVRYSAMSDATQKRFKREAKNAGLWVGGKSATANDLSALFFARSASLYMRKNGRIVFVLPYAAMSRDPYAKFRLGDFSPHQAADALQVAFTEAWSLPSDLQPLFPVPACVLFASRASGPTPLPTTVRRFAGRLPRRDARPDEAARTLTETIDKWPIEAGAGSVYRDRFKQGATLVPRRFMIVERLPANERFGNNPSAPRVKGRVTSLDKRPWSDVNPIEGPVEAEFLRTVWLGESIAPFRPLKPAIGVVPYEKSSATMMNASRAGVRNYPYLAAWLKAGESLWDVHSSKKMTWLQRMNYGSGISGQFPLAFPRIVYAASGTNPAAVLLDDANSGIIEHKLYWAPARSLEEGRYLCAVLNSETTRGRAEIWQSEGQFGKRDFDRSALNLPIPEFDPSTALHRKLADAAKRAEIVAANVLITEGETFTRVRSRIRLALRGDGVAQEIDELVVRLLGQSKLARVVATLRELPATSDPIPVDDDEDEDQAA